MKKRAIWEYFALTGLVCVVIIAILVIALWVIAMIAGAVANVAIWPLMIATSLGIKLTGFQVIMAGVVLTGLIFMYPEHVGKAFNHSVGAVLMTMLFGMFFGAIGLPLYAVITEVFGVNIPKWTIVPLAGVTIVALFKYRK
ncbi:MAG: hypothetical protein JKY82_00065 [Rhizobiaceae bacterium]|nr:hypothetical protein [Rhizobiaceae bacterium]